MFSDYYNVKAPVFIDNRESVTDIIHTDMQVINKDLTLSDREWFCPKCGELVSRDVNAAINIKNFALKNILSGTDRKNQGELSTMVEVLTLEAQPIAYGVGG